METLEDGKPAGEAPDAAREPQPILVYLACADDLAVPSWRRRLAPGERVVLGRGEPAAEPAPGTRRVALADPYLSAQHSVLDASSGAWRLSDAGSTNGTWLDGRRLAAGELAPLSDGAVIEVGHTFLLFRVAQPCPDRSPAAGDEPATLCPEWEATLGSIERLARSAHPVLIEGESGAGKDVVARMLHARSGRRGAMVSLNCAAVSEHLLEDELFGHVRGAYSGALGSRDGLIRAAHEGTLFLDEVGDMPPGLQARLLRVLEDHKVRPVGAEAEIAVDVRVIAATHRDLGALVAGGAFRHDLLARLGLIRLRVPALRERREDLGLLLRALLGPVPGGLAAVRFEVEALRAVLRHGWPLNVRELRSAVVSAADLARDDDGVAVIATRHLPIAVRAASPPAAAPPGAPDRRLTAEDEALRDHIVQLLDRHRGNVAAVARVLGKKRTTVQRLMARLGIERRAPALPATR